MSVVQDLISKGYGGYQGWGEAEANADFNATQGSGKFTGLPGSQSSGQSNNGGGSNFDMATFNKQQQEMTRQAIQPALDALKSQIPLLQQNTQAQVSQKQNDIAPLTQRYQTLIDSIKNQGQTSVNKQTVVTANELGKRGIEGSSTLAGQQIASATLPIEQNTQGLTLQAGQSREADIKAIQDAITNLQNQGIIDIGNVNTTSANLQSSSGLQAVQNALAQYTNQQQLNQSQNQYNTTLQQQKDQMAADARQNEITNALNTLKTNADVANTNSIIADRNKTNGTGGGNVASYYLPLGQTNVTGTPGNYQSTKGGTVIPQATTWKSG